MDFRFQVLISSSGGTLQRKYLVSSERGQLVSDLFKLNYRCVKKYSVHENCEKKTGCRDFFPGNWGNTGLHRDTQNSSVMYQRSNY